eukprot:SAG11_NODE_31386_length_292_cov_0.803109_1_plen_50_part_10
MLIKKIKCCEASMTKPELGRSVSVSVCDTEPVRDFRSRILLVPRYLVGTY